MKKILDSFTKVKSQSSAKPLNNKKEEREVNMSRELFRVKTSSGEHCEDELEGMGSRDLQKLLGEIEVNILGINEQLQREGDKDDVWRKRARGALWVNEQFKEKILEETESRDEEDEGDVVDFSDDDDSRSDSKGDSGDDDISYYFMEASRNILESSVFDEVYDEAVTVRRQLRG